MLAGKIALDSIHPNRYERPGNAVVTPGGKAETLTAEAERGATAVLLGDQLKAAGIHYQAEVELGRLVGRRWRVDFLLVAVLIGGAHRPVVVEVDGAVHRTKERFAADRAKARALAMLGFVLLPFTADEVRKGTAIADLRVLYGCADV